MLDHKILNFLKDLNKNNNKPWFDEHRKQYEIVKLDFYYLVEKLILEIAKFDAPIGELLVKECVFRINRDVRFSKNKVPYKTNLACYFNKGGKKSPGAGYYLHIEPGNSMIAGCIWMPESIVLGSIRQEIDYNFSNWKKIICHKKFKKVFTTGLSSNDRLIRPPKGYNEDNVAVNYIKMKNLIVSKSLTDIEFQSKHFIKEVAKIFIP